jgi:hypothetical protein
MKRNAILLIALACIMMVSCNTSTDQVENSTPKKDYYQLKFFNFITPEQEALLDSHFQYALLPALHRHGIRNVGVFKPIEGLNDESDFMVILIPFSSLEEFENLPDLLTEDTVYQQAGSAYINAPFDAPPYERIESYLLRAFKTTPVLVTPELDSPRPVRVYELRSYQSATEKLHKLKVEMFNEGEIAIFQDLDFNPVFFAEVLSSSHMPHLMYMTAHADTTAQKKNWDAFGVHPEWERMKNLERYQNTVSHIDRYLMYPTDYSDY